MSAMYTPLLIDRPIKVLLLGDSGVGKTCLMLRFSENKFTDSHVATVGIDFKLEKISVGNATVKLQIWDTAGQERFRNLTQAYFRNAKAVMLVFDVTDLTSFQNIEVWLKQLEPYAGSGIATLLVGNKSDRERDLWEMTESQITELAAKYKMAQIFTSAATGMNVREAFQMIAHQFIDRRPSKLQLSSDLHSDHSFYPSLSDVFEAKKKSACC